MKKGVIRLTSMLALIALWSAVFLHYQIPASHVPNDPVIKGIGFELAWRKSDRLLEPEESTEGEDQSRLSSVDPGCGNRARVKGPASGAQSSCGFDHARMARAPPFAAS